MRLPRQTSSRGTRKAALTLIAWLVLGSHTVSGAQWHNESGVRWVDLEVLKSDTAGFEIVPAGSSGILFTNRLPESMGAANRVLYNGAGVAVGDVDNDGLPDVFLCDLSGHNALYRNLGKMRFKDVTVEAGLSEPCPLTRGAVFADLNADGNLDLLLTITGKGVMIFLNDGHGKFSRAASPPLKIANPGSTSLALADIDGNGTLDLYVVNYRPDDVRDRGRVSMSMLNGRPVLAGSETNRFLMLNGQLAESGQPDQLFLNDGHANFKPVSWTDGTFLDESGKPLIEPPTDWGLTATFRDVNGDMAPDLYVCNDYWTPDRFWLNDGHGHFRAVEKLALRKTCASSMSVDFADIDRDGYVDFFVVDMLSRFPPLRKRQGFAQKFMATQVGVMEDRPQVMRNTLFLQRPDGTFAEIACYANLQASDWSWAPLFLDVDLDGYEDLLVGAGHFRDVQDYDAEQQVRARQHSWNGFKNDAERQQAFTRELQEHYHLYPLLELPIGAFRNRGDCSFEERTEAWGLNQPGVHQGMALADFDQDGSLDLIANNLNGPAMLFQNRSGSGRVAVRLKGRAPNTQGIGAKVSLVGGAVPRQTTEIVCGGRYQSGSDTEAVFATGSVAGGMQLEVTWRAGTHSVVRNVAPNRFYEIDESVSDPLPAEPVVQVVALFEDVSQLISHEHHESTFNDYERQPLLPFKLSQLGPGIGWFDLDGDGHEDLMVGAGRGSFPAVFRSDGHGGFSRWGSDTGQSVMDDTAGIIGWAGGSSGRAVLASLSGYEVKMDHVGISISTSNGQLVAESNFGTEMSTGGALALGDMDGDGRLALFIAGGVSPGHYPIAAPSKIYRFDGNQWKLDSKNSILLNQLGIVNGAVWSDLDGDGVPELVLACEWGPVRVFRNRGGSLFEVTEELGLKPFVGWWRGIATGDFNNDGKLDIVASNWGLNSPYRASNENPLTFAYGELAQPGLTEVIETEYVTNGLVPRRQFTALASSMPFLHEKFNSHKAYSEAGLDEVLGERKPLSKRVTANILTSVVFLNTGKGFKAVELPREAQFAPVFSVNVADLDGDGNEDIFMSQNFFDLQPEIARIDAGLGLWLQGDGTGKFSAASSSRSGIRVFGEQRGAALADYDEDGRVDLAVTQNGAQTKLYHNVGARPGLRIKLKGKPGNPEGINAVLRLQFKGGSGPAREIHAGSGYWSQDGSIQVMATPSQAESVSVRWPGGRTTVTTVPTNAREMTINIEGKLASSR